MIEGHKTSILDIEAALKLDYSQNLQKRYAQELCAAHVRTEKTLMAEVLAAPSDNVCGFDFVSRIHRLFFEQLPAEHQFTHGRNGFTQYSVMPGKMRDGQVSLDGGMMTHGPDAQNLPEAYEMFSRLHDAANFHGDERLIAVAASHHRLASLHPICHRTSGRR